MDVESRASQAHRLLEDPVLKEAFSAVLNEMIAEWITSRSEDAEKRESYYRNVVAVDRVRGKLKAFVDDGKMAAAAIERTARLSR